MPHNTTIAVLGAGYAGLFAARRAAQAVPAEHRGRVRVVLVDRERAWVERTRWHELAAGGQVAERPLDVLFRGTGVEVVTATVTGIDLAERALRVEHDREPPVRFDRLVLTLGSRSGAEQVPGVVEHGHTLDSSGSSRRVAAALARRPRSRVAVVGGGLTGIQVATQVAEAHPPAQVRLITSGEPAHELPPAARTYVSEALRRRGVGLDHGRVDAVDRSGYEMAGRTEPADVVVWVAGFTPSALADGCGLEVTDRGQVVLDPTLRSTSHPFVLAAGDVAAVPRAASSFGAYAATATGSVAGRNAVLDAPADRPARSTSATPSSASAWGVATPSSSCSGPTGRRADAS